MIKAGMEVVVPLDMGMDSWSAAAVWDGLDQIGVIPPIFDRVPYASELIWWGRLPDGSTFFVANVAETKSGLTCQVTIFPATAKEVLHDAFLTDWLRRIFFRGKVTEEPSCDEPRHHVFHTDELCFILRNLVQTLGRVDISSRAFPFSRQRIS